VVLMLLEIPVCSVDTWDPMSTMKPLSTPSISFIKGTSFFIETNRLYRDSLFRYGEAARAVILYASLSFPEVLICRLSPGTCERFEFSDVFSCPVNQRFLSFLILVGHCSEMPPALTCNSVLQLLFSFSDSLGLCRSRTSVCSVAPIRAWVARLL